MLISIHIPKNAGTSFVAILKNIYKDKLFVDHNDDYISTRRQYICARLNDLVNHRYQQLIKNNYQCIHGHFIIRKYAWLFPQAKYAIWFRDPVERIASHYYWFERLDPNYLKQSLGRFYALSKNSHDKIVDHLYNIHNLIINKKLSLIDFASNPMAHNVQYKFLNNYNLSKIDFVGIVEKSKQSLDLFKKVISLNLELTEPKYNANPNRSNEKYEIDAKTRKIIEKYNLKDMDLYLKAKNRFTELCQQYSVAI